ncbi:MAG: hypothetical protein H0V09_04970, partial [Gemmatimonadetes bacterium]|nr:hypothetical protein [Gemmatimonadota bacterium]
MTHVPSRRSAPRTAALARAARSPLLATLLGCFSAVLLFAGCQSRTEDGGEGERAATVGADTSDTGQGQGAADSTPEVGSGAVPGGFVIRDAGFLTPESVVHDEASDVYLVSNINGSPFAADDNGFISRLSPEGEVLDLRWIDGGNEAVNLNGPKGLAIRGDSLFAADLDSVRIFS